MKKTKALLTVSLLSLSLFGVLSCGSENVGTSSSSSVMESSFSLSESSLDLIFGDSATLTVKGASSADSISWESSDPKVASVSDGKVVAVGKGNAIITAQNGSSKATCFVTVGFGDVLPSFSIDSLIDDSLLLAVGSRFALSGRVSFNGETYPCPIGVSFSSDVISMDGDSVVARKEGEATLKVKGFWNGFEGPLMEKEIKVSVSKNVSLYAEVTLGSETSVSNSVSLSIIPSWKGVSYQSEATVAFKAKDGGVIQDANVVVADDEIVSISKSGLIKAKKKGTTTVHGEYYDSEGNLFKTFVKVQVFCPVADYDEEIRISSESPFPVETYFGKGAVITYAKQGDRELSFTPSGFIKELEALGGDSEPLTVLTSKGGLHFKSTFVYTKALNASNFKSAFQLSEGRIIKGYYILDSDIDQVIDMTSQTSSYYKAGDAKSRYFAGTFDGLGHKIKVKVGREGIFGGLGEQPTIKNTHFEFTFKDKNYCSGLARNNWTNSIKGWEATLSNLYVTTTNYFDHSYALFETRFNNLNLTDIYVNLTLDESCEEVKSASEEKGALFKTDNTIAAGPYTAFEGAFKNVYVVSGVFMPIGSGYINQNLFASYAYNDVDKLGDYRNGGVSSQIMYCVIDSKDNNPKESLFGTNVASWYFKDDMNAKLAWVYYARPTIRNGGIKRYDSVEQLKAENVTTIGSWSV